MKIICAGKDLSEVIEKVTWSGDKAQVARKLEFTIAKNSNDPDFPVVVIDPGAEVLLYDDNNNILFGGIVFTPKYQASSNTKSYLAYDLLWYVNKYEISKDYNATPEAIAADVCTELGITPGNIAQTGVVISNPCIKKTGYVIIQSSYTAVARMNGKKYMPIMQEINKLSVIEKGTECGVILKADLNGIECNMTDAEYSTSIETLVNRVLIQDKNGNTIKTVEDTESQQKYGTVQVIITQDDGKDATQEAQQSLVNVTSSASVSGIDDTRAISGYSIIVVEPDTGLMGKFYIESDTHTYSNGSATMQLTLAFENLMDEQEIDTNDN